jgi:hypothetical protein
VVAGHPFRWASQQEKEARLVLQELWAKVGANQKFVAYGAVAVLVGWIVGQFIATSSAPGYTILGTTVGGYSISWFSSGNAGLFAILGLVGAIAAVVVLYLKFAPSMNITWPMPFAQILLGISGAVLVCGVLVVLMQVSRGIDGAPVTMWLADLIFVGGGAAMAWFSYQDYLVSKSIV